MHWQVYALSLQGHLKLLLDKVHASYTVLNFPDHEESLSITTGVQNLMGLHCPGFSASQLELDTQGEERD